MIHPVPIYRDGRRPVITSGYLGSRPDHFGVDIMYLWQHGDFAEAPIRDGRGFMPGGIPALAITKGKVTLAKKIPSGLAVQIKFGPYVANYLHLSKILVKKGQMVEAGQAIGIIGAYAGVNHLHFEMAKGRRYFNPETSIKKMWLLPSPFAAPFGVQPSVSLVVMGVPGLVYYYWKRQSTAPVWPLRVEQV